MEKYLCLSISEAVAEVAACRDYVVECQNTKHKDLKLAKAALRSAERELRAWQKGIVPTLSALSAAA